MATLTPPLATDDPLPSYAGLPGRYDECRAPDGSLRPAWAEFLGQLGPDPSATLGAATDACYRAVLEQDVSMNVYAGLRSESKPWPLDVVPQLVTAEDWAILSEGLKQRAGLFNTLLSDLYGPQKYFRGGIVPAELTMANPRFLRPCSGLGIQKGVYLHHYAVDVGRSPDGKWWVLQDRLDAPSGFGYTFQNRRIVRTTLSEEIRGMQAESLARFSRDFRNSLLKLAPPHPKGEEPRVVFLTPGHANETYSEHAYLARFLGHTLVEGADLTTRDRQVFLRTVGGLKPVSVIVRRVDSGFCDPLELNASSVLGVPGLVHVAQGGRVAIANQLGGAALESSSLLAFLAPLSRAVLGEDLRLPSIATWWCGQEAQRSFVLENLHSLVIKPSFRERGAFATRYGPLLSAEERQALAANIRARPGSYCGQERLLLGTTPAWVGGALRPVPFVMRLFVAWHNGEYRVMPGGLTRYDSSGADAIVSLQKGSATKDTWVLSKQQSENLVATARAEVPVGYHKPESTPSRLADNLYWLGRYLERTAQRQRILDQMEPLLRNEIATLEPPVIRDSLRILLALQEDTPEDSTLSDMAEQIRADAEDPDRPGGLAANLAQLIHALDQVKANLPPEFWRSLRSLKAIAAQGNLMNEPDLGPQLAALEALCAETLTHDLGWHFLRLGSRIERARSIVFLADELLLPEREPGEPVPPPSEFRMQTLLHFTDCLFTYRSLYPGEFQPATILSWLIEAPENPRGLRYQAEKIAEHVSVLPEDLAPHAVSALRATAFRLLAAAKQIDTVSLTTSPHRAGEFLGTAQTLLTELNERLTQVYFSHSDIPDSGW